MSYHLYTVSSHQADDTWISHTVKTTLFFTKVLLWEAGPARNKQTY